MCVSIKIYTFTFTCSPFHHPHCDAIHAPCLTDRRKRFLARFPDSIRNTLQRQAARRTPSTGKASGTLYTIFRQCHPPNLEKIINYELQSTYQKFKCHSTPDPFLSSLFLPFLPPFSFFLLFCLAERTRIYNSPDSAIWGCHLFLSREDSTTMSPS